MDWSIKNLDDKTAIRALDVRVKELDLSVSPPSAVFIGSKGEEHHATLESCDCVDYQLKGKKNQRPCKHIVCIAMETGMIDRQAVLNYIDFREKAKKEMEFICHGVFVDTVIENQKK